MARWKEFFQETFVKFTFIVEEMFSKWQDGRACGSRNASLSKIPDTGSRQSEGLQFFSEEKLCPIVSTDQSNKGRRSTTRQADPMTVFMVFVCWQSQAWTNTVAGESYDVTRTGWSTNAAQYTSTFLDKLKKQKRRRSTTLSSSKEAKSQKYWKEMKGRFTTTEKFELNLKQTKTKRDQKLKLNAKSLKMFWKKGRGQTERKRKQGLKSHEESKGEERKKACPAFSCCDSIFLFSPQVARVYSYHQHVCIAYLQSQYTRGPDN